MSELRRDPIVGRWVIVDTDHPNTPKDFEYEQSVIRGGICPFCSGNEAMTPPEIDSIRSPGSASNKPGWQVRVVPNKFPALTIEGVLDKRGIGIYDMCNGIGAHEILIETPQHNKDISDLKPEEASNVVRMWCRRALDLTKDKRFKYIMLFRNYGLASGASLEHPHSQIVALPMVPKSVGEEIKGAHEYYNYRERCIFCDIIKQEANDKERIVAENDHFVAFCPFVSRFPFEVWIIPKEHSGYFCHMSEEEVPAVAKILLQVIKELKKVFANVSYNFILHSAPVNGDFNIEYYHWHIELMPRLTRTAGFEWGSGFYIDPISPELAAKYLKEK